MKKLIILILAIGLSSLFSCKKDETKVVLTFFEPAQILTPASASKYILKKENKDSVLITYTWSAATYNLTGSVVKPTYTLEMDTAGGNFSKPTVLNTTQDYSYSITVGAMNDLVLGAFKGVADSLATFQFRVRASLSVNNPATNNISQIITLEITPYSSVVIVSPIYLLGSATAAGWDNTKGLAMTHIGSEGQFVIVAHLSTGTTAQIKFIANLGAWAPQWGTDAAAIPDSGNLVLRPTEAVPDPPAIPAPAVEGDYRIMADTANLRYHVTLTSSQLFLVGDATTAGWDNTKGIPLVQDSVGYFSLTTTFTAGTGAGMKLLEVSGQWAPQWGTDASGTGSFGKLVYRITESVPDPPVIPSPGAGTFTLSVNLATLEYHFSAK